MLIFKQPALILIFILLSTILFPTLLNAQQPQVDEWHYTLRPGDSLQKVTKGLLNRQHTWADLVRYNNIERVSSLAPGSIIKVPMHWLKHQPKPALAKAISGNVMIKRASKNNYKPLKESMSIRVGDEVATRKGNVLIEFADKSTIRLEEDSTLVFNKLSHFGKTGMVDTRLRLKKGSLSTEVTPLVKGSRYEITTPSAVAAVRGTEFRLSTDDTKTRVEVVEGVVEFTGEHGTTEVKAGYGAEIKQNRAIVQSSKLPEPPKAMFTDAVIDTLPTILKWEEQQGANAYQVQITDAMRNNKLVQEAMVNMPELTLENIENGDYDISMRAIDAKGFEGPNTVSRVSINIGIEKATLIAPLEKSTLNSNSIEFSWKFVKPNLLGKIQISKDKGFNLVLGESKYDSIKEINYDKGLLPGHYYWRVVALSEDGQTANSDPRSFAVRGLLKPVKILSVNYVENEVGLFWNKVDNTQAYILQISESKGFETILKEQTITKARAHLRLNPGKRYFARVKGIGNELFSSEFGPIKELYIEEQ